MLTPWRRHRKDCPHKHKGRAWKKCSCPIWCDGLLNGKRYRKPLDTWDWSDAMRKCLELQNPAIDSRPLCARPGCTERVEAGRCAKHRRTIPEAIAAFLNAKLDVAPGTRRNYKRTLRFLEEFTTARGLVTVDEIDLDTLGAFRVSRPIGALTWVKELEILRQFFNYCDDAEWVDKNWAKKVPTPRNVKPGPREPYEPNEIARIIAACDTIGLGTYERLRARAMVLLLRYTALRISDVATLRKDRIRDGEIHVRTTKNGKAVRLPVHPDLQAALDVLPAPRGAEGRECPYFFWSGNGTTRAVIRDVTRTLATVYKASGVPGACSHRFRHTLATEVLELGGTFEDAADILGDSEAIVRKHYAKWSAGRQARISGLLARLWHTKKSSLQAVEKSRGYLVDGMGFEPTTPALRTPCSPS